MPRLQQEPSVLTTLYEHSQLPLHSCFALMRWGIGDSRSLSGVRMGGNGHALDLIPCSTGIHSLLPHQGRTPVVSTPHSRTLAADRV